MDERSIRYAVLGLLGVIGLVAAAVASHAVSSPTGFFVVTGMAITAMYATAGLMLGWYAVRRGSARHLILSITFAFTAGAFALQSVHPHGVSAPWMWATSHILLPAGIVLALLPEPKALREVFAPPATRLRGASIAAGYVVSLLAIVYLAPLRGDLPTLHDPTTLLPLGLVVVAVSGVAVAIGLRRGRREDLESWLTIVAAATLVDAALTIGAGHPGTIGEMMGRVISLVASLAMLRAVMQDAGRLWTKLGFAGRFAPLDDASGVLDEHGVLAQARLLMPTSPASASLSVVVLAVDGVEGIYDQFGHLTGDRVTGEVGRRMRATLRDADVVGQRGDEAFILLLPQTDVDGARIAVDRVLESIRCKAISGVRDSVPVTASAGVAEAHGDDDLDRILAAAASALDAAHNAGGDRLIILSPSVDSHGPPPFAVPESEPQAEPSLPVAA